mmetsp:Transcript_65292/g.141718  ORF Transcript_65292/g.141718 Transcript_65292/m.141718 type:complete len:218 (+) Transcript_65292:283-936(+)
MSGLPLPTQLRGTPCPHSSRAFYLDPRPKATYWSQSGTAAVGRAAEAAAGAAAAQAATAPIVPAQGKDNNEATMEPLSAVLKPPAAAPAAVATVLATSPTASPAESGRMPTPQPPQRLGGLPQPLACFGGAPRVGGASLYVATTRAKLTEDLGASGGQLYRRKRRVVAAEAAATAAEATPTTTPPPVTAETARTVAATATTKAMSAQVAAPVFVTST